MTAVQRAMSTVLAGVTGFLVGYYVIAPLLAQS